MILPTLWSIFKLKEKGLSVGKAVYEAPEKYKFHVKRGSGIIGRGVRETFGGGVSELAKGTFGIGAHEYFTGKEGWFPDWGRPGAFPKAMDISGKGKGLVNVTVPPISFPEIPKDLIKFPNINFPDFSMPEIKIPSGIVQVGKLPNVTMGADILGGLETPDFSFRNDEGDINPLAIAALAIGGFYIIKKVA